jgi:hydroxyacylglutathione hydrolase
MLKVKVLTFSPIQENTYILYNEDHKAIIIDPGCYSPVEQKMLKSFIEDTKLVPIQLLNTHCHLDHVFGNKWVHETWGLELYLHMNEEMVLKQAPAYGEMWGMPFENYAGPLHFLDEQDVIMLGDNELSVLLTPGHSPGSICFYNAAQKIIIGGDVLFRDGIGRTDLPGGDHETLLGSIREKLFVLPDDVTVYPGHGESTTIGYEKENNPFL